MNLADHVSERERVRLTELRRKVELMSEPQRWQSMLALSSWVFRWRLVALIEALALVAALVALWRCA